MATTTGTRTYNSTTGNWGLHIITTMNQELRFHYIIQLHKRFKMYNIDNVFSLLHGGKSLCRLSASFFLQKSKLLQAESLMYFLSQKLGRTEGSAWQHQWKWFFGTTVIFASHFFMPTFICSVHKCGRYQRKINRLHDLTLLSDYKQVIGYIAFMYSKNILACVVVDKWIRVSSLWIQQCIKKTTREIPYSQ